MLVGGQSKLQLAAEEGVKLKKLVGAVRALWRSSPAGNHPRVSELKNMLRPSPNKRPRAVTSNKVKCMVCAAGVFIVWELFFYVFNGQ